MFIKRSLSNIYMPTQYCQLGKLQHNLVHRLPRCKQEPGWHLHVPILVLRCEKSLRAGFGCTTGLLLPKYIAGGKLKAAMLYPQSNINTKKLLSFDRILSFSCQLFPLLCMDSSQHHWNTAGSLQTHKLHEGQAISSAKGKRETFPILHHSTCYL